MISDMYVELHVPDFNIAKDFYQKLGFEIVWEKHPTADEPKQSYLVMKNGDNILGFWPGNESVWEQTYFKNFPKDTKRGYGVEIVMNVTDIDNFYEKVKTFAKIVGELKIKHWGLKDFRIEDPFGFYIRFTEPHDILEKGSRT